MPAHLGDVPGEPLLAARPLPSDRAETLRNIAAVAGAAAMVAAAFGFMFGGVLLAFVRPCI